MKKITTFLLSLTVLCSTTFGQILLSEGFNANADGSAPAFPPTDWTVIDVDDSTINSTAFANFPAFLTGSFQYGNVGGNFGGAAISSSVYDPRGTSDDWLITPSLSIPTAVAGKSTVLNYIQGEFAGPAPYDAAVVYELRVSTTGNAVADFTDLITTTNTAIGTGINLVSVDLTSYGGQDIYLAWVDVSTDSYVLYIDVITVETLDDDAISLSAASAVDIASDGDNVTFSGTIVNRGASNITSYDVTWNDGSGDNVYSVTGVDIAPLFSSPFTHSTDLVAANPGNFTNVTVTVSNPNGSTDQDVTDNSQDVAVFVNNGTGVSRTVLVEEYSDAACQFCPDGAVAVEQIKNDYPNAIVVQHHGGYQFDDGMTIDEIEDYQQFPMGGLPAATMDRSIINPAGARSVAWVDAVGELEAQDAFVELEIGGFIDVIRGNTFLDLDIDVEFKDFVVPGDIRLTVFLVEDIVNTNPTVGGYDADWDQVNWYNPNGAANHPYRNEGTPIGTVSYIDAFEHKDVVRDVWPSDDAWGSDQAVTKNAPVTGDKFSQKADFQIDSEWDFDEMTIVAFLSYYDGNDVLKRTVLNAAKVPVSNFAFVGIDENASVVNNLEIYPNPTSSVANVSLKLSENSDVEVRLFDIAGKELRYEDFGTMTAGTQKINLNVSDLSNGMYFVNLRVGEETITRKVSVNK